MPKPTTGWGIDGGLTTNGYVRAIPSSSYTALPVVEASHVVGCAPFLFTCTEDVTVAPRIARPRSTNVELDPSPAAPPPTYSVALFGPVPQIAHTY